jgi:hypothetical protein
VRTSLFSSSSKVRSRLMPHLASRAIDVAVVALIFTVMV